METEAGWISRWRHERSRKASQGLPSVIFATGEVGGGGGLGVTKRRGGLIIQGCCLETKRLCHEHL